MFGKGFDWKATIGSIAPAIGTALGGPVGGLATKFLADKLLGNPDASETDIASFVQGMTPEQAATLKKLDQDFAVQMRELEIDVFRIEVKDRASARDLFKVNIWPQIALSALYTIGYFAILATVVNMMMGEQEINDAVMALVSGLLGLLTGELPRINGFWFGSSMGSKEKTAKQPADAGPQPR
ncbi:MAG: hypothetical protein AAF354_10155 [Pseudomonadota bacterium]